MSMRPKGLPEVPERTVMVARAAFPKGSLAMRVRDRLAEVFADEPFASAFGVRGAPGLSPGVLCLVTVLQPVEQLDAQQFRPPGQRELVHPEPGPLAVHPGRQLVTAEQAPPL